MLCHICIYFVFSPFACLRVTRVEDVEDVLAADVACATGPGFPSQCNAAARHANAALTMNVTSALAPWRRSARRFTFYGRFLKL